MKHDEDEHDMDDFWLDDGGEWLYDGGNPLPESSDYLWVPPDHRSDPKDNSECRHEWKVYKGFHMDEYEYCVKCDLKRPLPGGSNEGF